MGGRIPPACWLGSRPIGIEKELYVRNIQEKRFDAGSVTLNYAEILSSLPALVLIHGGSARWQEFESIMPDLMSSFHIYAPDLRGHGKSDWAPRAYRLQDYADDITAFLQRNLKEPAFLFGHSLGGIIALMVAAQFPAGVRAVAVGDAPLSSKTWHDTIQQGLDRITAWKELAGGQKPLPEMIELLKESPVEVPGQSEPVPFREVVGEDSPVFDQWLAPNLYHNDPDMLGALIERFEATAAGYEMERVLPAIKCPVLLMQADPSAGGLMTDDEVGQAFPVLARPHHVKLEGISHILHMERKEPVVKALERFFGAC
jgi:pimeloyl-ACP methyl ester carboxylesterase